MNCEQIRSRKLVVLKNFINSNKDLAPQGSEQWLKDRQTCIGGSEISSVIGKNPFSTLQGLIAQKVSLTSFNGNTACRWGNLFENVSELLFKILFIDTSVAGNKIYATGSIQHNTIKNHRYSPDGLCCVLFHENGEKIYKTTLLEFKSPYSSIPTASVPPHYLPQVKAGLCTIDIAETAIFVNNMFRKCQLKQLDYTLNYDTSYHKDTDKKLQGINTVIANGIIMFSINLKKLHSFMSKYNKLRSVDPDIDSDIESDLTDGPFVLTNKHLEFLPLDIESNDFSDSESDTEDYRHFDDGSNILYKIYKNILNYQEDVPISQKLGNLTKNMIDLGLHNKQLFDQFLALYKPEDNDTFIDIKCIKPQINPEALSGKLSNFVVPHELGYIKENAYANNICKKYNSGKLISAFIDSCIDKQHIPIAYLPYKLLRSSNIVVDKDTEYLESIKEKIDSCIDIVKDITANSKTMDDTANLFESYFQNNSITKKYFEDKPHSESFLMEFL
jgi:hypothetical protein